MVKVQILLDRALFSPGEIDGKLAENTQKALRAFADAKGLTFQKTLTPELWAKLTETSQDAVISQYTITEKRCEGTVPAKAAGEDGGHERRCRRSATPARARRSRRNST